MQPKIRSKRTLLIIIPTGFVFFLLFLFYFIQPSSNLPADRQVESASVTASITTPTPPLHEQEQTSPGLPTHLKIPKINVDSALDYVGITSGGAVDVPKGPTNAAWFDLGPRPGEKGSAIIDGHSGWKNGIQAVFDNLYKLKKGDKLYIQDKNGMTMTFVVREVRIYSWNENVPEVFSSSDEKAHLNLISCTGIWDKIRRSHSSRLVVFTDKE